MHFCGVIDSSAKAPTWSQLSFDGFVHLSTLSWCPYTTWTHCSPQGRLALPLIYCISHDRCDHIVCATTLLRWFCPSFIPNCPMKPFSLFPVGFWSILQMELEYVSYWPIVLVLVDNWKMFLSLKSRMSLSVSTQFMTCQDTDFSNDSRFLLHLDLRGIEPLICCLLDE